MGQIDAAIEPSILSIQGFKKSESWFEAAATSVPLISMLISAGRLRDARQEWNSGQKSLEAADNEVLQAVSIGIGAYLSFLEGDLPEAVKLFDDAELILNKEEPVCEWTSPTISAYYCKVLLDTGETERALERALLTLEWRRTKSWQVGVDTTSLYATDLLVLGLIYLELDDTNNASYYLNKSVELFKASNEWLYLPSGLIGRAKLFNVEGNHVAAQRDLEEALAIAKNTGALLSTWEANIALAELAVNSEDLHAGQLYFERAIQLKGMGSYRHYSEKLKSLKVQLYSGRGNGHTPA